jgi:hypothetical protein
VCPLLFSPNGRAAFCDPRVLFSPGERYAKVGIELEDAYLWDNWTLYNPREKRYFRYALSASKRDAGGAEGRHTLARLRVFTSADGRHWTDEGLVWPDQLTWSGHTRVDANGEYEIFVTLPDAATDKLTQKIAVARSADGIHFPRPDVLLDPSDPRFRARAEALGYDLGEADGIVMALRDPYAIGDDLFFAGKMKDPRSGKIIPAVGHARLIAGAKTELLAPIRLPVEKEILQIEVPNVVRIAPERYLMSVNLYAPPRTWVRIYESKSLGGPWHPAVGRALDSDGTLFRPEDHIYGFNLVSGTKTVQGSGFFMPGAAHPFSLTRLIEIP